MYDLSSVLPPNPDLPDLSNFSSADVANLECIVKDLLAGDPDAAKRPEFTGLNIAQIKAALDYILNNPDLSAPQKTELLANSWRVNYRDRPPSPEEFLTEKYLGPTAATIYPWVREAFIEFLNPTKPYRTIVLYPYIGWGKSYAAVLINMFVGTHLSMMKAPWKFFGQSPATVYTQVFCATSLKKSSELLFEPMLNMLEASPFFEKVHSREAMIKRDMDFSRMNNINNIYWTTAVPTSAIQFSNGANFKLISSPNGLLGQTIVTGTMTELSFFHEAGKSDDFVFKFFSKLRGRIESRIKGNYFGRFILDSSPNTLESVIDDWICHTAPKNKANYIVRGARWLYAKNDFEPGTFDSTGRIVTPKTFTVFVGGKGRPPVIIDNEDIGEYSPEDLVTVPDTLLNSSYRGIFEENLFEALKDQAGIPAGSSDKIFYDHEKIEAIFEPKLKNIYTHISAPSTEDPINLIWNQIKNEFFTKILDKYYFWYKPYLPRAVSVDLSISGDIAAVAITHVERESPSTSTEGTDTKPIYVTDLVITITPSGGRINQDAIRYLITDLVEKGNMSIAHVSFDQFQSEATMQYLQRRGLNVEKLSVDKTNDPYLYFIGQVESGHFKCGRNIHVKNNLKSLQMFQRKGPDGKKTGSVKIDHTAGDLVHTGDTSWERSLIGIHAKDAADAICASIELLRKNGTLAYDVWEPSKIVEKTKESASLNLQELLRKKGLA